MISGLMLRIINSVFLCCSQGSDFLEVAKSHTGCPRLPTTQSCQQSITTAISTFQAMELSLATSCKKIVLYSYYSILFCGVENLRKGLIGGQLSKTWQGCYTNLTEFDFYEPRTFLRVWVPLMISPQIAEPNTGLSPWSVPKDIVRSPAAATAAVIATHRRPASRSSPTSSVPHGRLRSTFLPLSK